MEWQEITIHTVNEASEAISNILNDLGANGVVIEDSFDLLKQINDSFGEHYNLNSANYPEVGMNIKAYFPKDKRFSLKLEQLKQKVDKLKLYGLPTESTEITTSIVHEQDWENEWKKFFKPTKITNRFVIIPKWENYESKEKDMYEILIDPGMAFGTGTHPTTILSIQGLESTVKLNDIVLDVGSGSGILSIASILLGASTVFAYDVDEIAVKSTGLNRDLNQLEQQIEVSQNNLLQGISKQADIIVSNILADILIDLVDDAWSNLIDGGYFITSGIIKPKENKVRKKLEKKSFQIVQTNRLENWVSFIAKK